MYLGRVLIRIFPIHDRVIASLKVVSVWRTVWIFEVGTLSVIENGWSVVVVGCFIDVEGSLCVMSSQSPGCCYGTSKVQCLI